MSAQTPPPLPDPNSAFRTYVRAVATLFPTMIVWLFARTFLVPKLEQIWREAGIDGSKAQWLMDASDAVKHSFYPIVAGGLLLLCILEFRWAAWPRYRRAVIGAIVVFLHGAVLIGITAIATAAVLAVPMVLKRG